MHGFVGVVAAIHKDELRPFESICIETEHFKLVHLLLVHLVGQYGREAGFDLVKFGLCHLHGLAVLTRQIETLTEILVRLGLGQINRVERIIRAVI